MARQQALTHTQREWRKWGVVDADVIFDGKLRFRCPECGQRFTATVSRRPVEQGGMHRLSGICECGETEVTGTIAATFRRVWNDEEDAA